MDPHDELNTLLAQAGVSKIVYALVMPETEQVIDRVLDGTNSRDGRSEFHTLFREAWTQKQDRVHEDFFAKWLQWTQSVVQLDPDAFPFQYPTAGASEGLREAIHAYSARARRENFAPNIHLFEGEYEGYAAYARAANIPLTMHRRSDWEQAIDRVCPDDQFYVSQPSAIDGYLWDEFDSFAGELNRKVPKAQLMLDLSYVGCVGRTFLVNANHPNIPAVFVSLSKPAGVYYHRIGGVFSRHEYLGLFGNKWFKNIASLKIGTEFMNSFGVHELPRKYSIVQQFSIDRFNQEFNTNLQAADIFLLGVGKPTEHPSELERYLLRGARGAERVRVCLTARMANRIDPKLDSTVAARYYERI